LGHMADDLCNTRSAVGLRQLGVAGQRVDDVAGKVSAVGRGQRGPLLALEVVMQHQFAVIASEDEVDARPFEIAGEQQMRIGNNDGTGRCMRRNAVDMDMRIRMRALTVRQYIVKFAGQAQRAPSPLRLIKIQYSKV